MSASCLSDSATVKDLLLAWRAALVITSRNKCSILNNDSLSTAMAGSSDFNFSNACLNYFEVFRSKWSFFNLEPFNGAFAISFENVEKRK